MLQRDALTLQLIRRLQLYQSSARKAIEIAIWHLEHIYHPEVSTRSLNKPWAWQELGHASTDRPCTLHSILDWTNMTGHAILHPGSEWKHHIYYAKFTILSDRGIPARCGKLVDCVRNCRVTSLANCQTRYCTSQMHVSPYTSNLLPKTRKSRPV